jgi:hypothetical protein
MYPFVNGELKPLEYHANVGSKPETAAQTDTLKKE